MWFGLKTVLAPLLLVAVIWFKKRINRLPRRSYLFERYILVLNCCYKCIFSDSFEERCFLMKPYKL